MQKQKCLDCILSSKTGNKLRYAYQSFRRKTTPKLTKSISLLIFAKYRKIIRIPENHRNMKEFHRVVTTWVAGSE